MESPHARSDGEPLRGAQAVESGFGAAFKHDGAVAAVRIARHCCVQWELEPEPPKQLLPVMAPYGQLSRSGSSSWSDGDAADGAVAARDGALMTAELRWELALERRQ